MKKIMKTLAIAITCLSMVMISVSIKTKADFVPQDYTNTPMHYKIDREKIINNWRPSSFKFAYGHDETLEGYFDRTLYIPVQNTNNVFTTAYVGTWWNMGDRTLLNASQIKQRFGNRVIVIEKYIQIGLNGDGNITYLCPITLDNQTFYVEVNTMGTAKDNYENEINLKQLWVSTITLHGVYEIAYGTYDALNDYGTWNYPYGVWDDEISQTGTLEDLLYTVINTPVMYVKKITDITLLGTNVMQMLGTIILIILMIKIWKVLK